MKITLSRITEGVIWTRVGDDVLIPMTMEIDGRAPQHGELCFKAEDVTTDEAIEAAVKAMYPRADITFEEL